MSNTDPTNVGDVTDDVRWGDPLWVALERAAVNLEDDPRLLREREHAWQGGLNTAEINRLALSAGLGQVFEEHQWMDGDQVVSRSLEVCHPGPRDSVLIETWNRYGPIGLSPQRIKRIISHLRDWQGVWAREVRGDRAAAPPRDLEGCAFAHDGNVWKLTFGGETRSLSAKLKGLEDIAQLIQNGGKPVMALDLFGTILESDLGPVLDEEGWDDLEQRAASARAEGRADAALELEEYLRQYGDHRGRARLLGGKQKRARDAVRNRINRAMAVLADSFPTLHDHIRDRLNLKDPYIFEIREGDPSWLVKL